MEPSPRFVLNLRDMVVGALLQMFPVSVMGRILFLLFGAVAIVGSTPWCAPEKVSWCRAT